MSSQNGIIDIKHKLIDRALFATAIYACIPLSTSLIRTINISWQPIYSLHIIVAFCLFLLFFFRKKLNLAIKAHAFLVLYLIVSLAGVITFNTINGIYYITVVVAISTILFGLRTGVYYSIVFIIAYSLIAFLHIQNILISTINFNDYANATTTWISQLTGILYVVLIILYTVSLFYKYFIGALNSLFQKNNELELALAKVKSEEQRFYNVVESSNDGYLFVNKDFIITYVNSSFSKLSGYQKSDIIGKNYRTWLQERYDDWEEYFQTLLNAVNKSDRVIYMDIAGKNGKLNPVEINLYESNDESNLYVWGVVKDLQEKKNLENQIFSTMIQAEEKERERYAKDLHDGMGPLLSTSMIYINTILEDSTNDTIKDFAQRAFDLLKESTGTIREISNNLSPLILREYGIAQAVRSFIEKAQNVHDIKFKIVDNISERFSESVEITLYRTLIELINNSLKYSKAKSITITFEMNKGARIITFTDDGKGFDYNKTIENKLGYGLINLESRIKKLGGEYHYQTAEGEGVCVTIRLKPECI